MESKAPGQPGMPELKPEVLRPSDEKKGGLLAPLLSGLGLGGGSSGGAASLAAVLSSKAGLVALILAGSGVAAGVGILAGVDRTGAPAARRGVFASAGEEKLDGSMAQMAQEQGGQAAAASAGGASTSLDYVSQANKSPEPAASAGDGQVSDAAGAAPSASAPRDSGVQPPDHGAAAGAAGAAATAARAERPKLVKGDGSAAKSGGAGGSGLQLAAQAGLSSGISGEFGQTFRQPQRTASSSNGSESRSLAAARRSALSARSGLASRQAVDTNRVTSGAKKSSMAEGAARYGATYDGSGGAPAGQLGGTSAPSIGGAGSGEKGADGVVNPSTVQNMRETPPPPELKNGQTEDKTPYKGLVTGAMIAMAVGGVALFAASACKKHADKLGVATPAAAPWLAAAKALAVVAMIAAGAAAVCGIMMAMKPYEQTMQGLMFAGIGAVIAFQAGMVLVDANASEKSDAGVKGKAVEGGKEMETKMPGAKPPAPAQAPKTMLAQAPKGVGNVPPAT